MKSRTPVSSSITRTVTPSIGCGSGSGVRQTISGTASQKDSRPAPSQARRRSSSSPLSRTLTVKPRARPAKNTSARAMSASPRNEASERKALLATTGIQVPLAHSTAPPPSSSAPRLPQWVSARSNAMRVRWPSSASDGGSGPPEESAWLSSPSRSLVMEVSMPHPACKQLDCRESAASAELEDGVVGGHGSPLGVAGVGRDTLEEHPRLELPAAEVGAQDRHAVGHRDLLRRAELASPPQDQHHVPSGVAHVADPLRLAAGGDEVLRPLDRQQVHGDVVQLAGGPAPVLEDAGAPHAHADAGQTLDQRVEDVPGEPAGLLVVGRNRRPGGRRHGRGAHRDLLGARSFHEQ